MGEAAEEEPSVQTAPAAGVSGLSEGLAALGTHPSRAQFMGHKKRGVGNVV